jgi:hypothetical protein
MNMRELINIFEAPKATTAITMDRQTVQQVLTKFGYEDLKIKGNLVAVVVQIPEKVKKDEFRKKILADIATAFNKAYPQTKAQVAQNVKISSIGVVSFPGSPVIIGVKDVGKQGDKSAGVANEFELAAMIQSVVEKHGFANVTFVDPRGKSISINQATSVDVSGRAAGGRNKEGGVKKADVVLRSAGKNLPISIKKLDAEAWESADNLFGHKAREIITRLQDEGYIKLAKSQDDTGRVYYTLNKEIVVEPTPEEALTAVFGEDLNPQGGIVIQTFKPEHFVQENANITVQCHAVIQTRDDIPESHLMVWLLRNDKTRNSKSLGIPGIKPMAVTLTRGIGTRGTKDVVLVDKNGNVLRGGLNQPAYEPPKEPVQTRARRPGEAPRQRR